MTAHVLAARLDSAGDVLLMGPALRAIAATGARVTLLVSPAGRPAAALLPGVHAIHPWRAPWIEADPDPVSRRDTLALVRTSPR
jgi:ADP-heptose:LPS heptosyltransferase